MRQGSSKQASRFSSVASKHCIEEGSFRESKYVQRGRACMLRILARIQKRAREWERKVMIIELEIRNGQA